MNEVILVIDGAVEHRYRAVGCSIERRTPISGHDLIEGIHRS